MRHRLRGVCRDLLGIVSFTINYPNATRASPGSIHRDPFAVRRIRRADRVLDQLVFFAGAKLQPPHVPAIVLAEDIAGLHLARYLMRPHEK